MRSWVYVLVNNSYKKGSKKTLLIEDYYQDMQNIVRRARLVFGSSIVVYGDKSYNYKFEIDGNCPASVRKEFFARGFKRYRWIKGELVEK